MTDNTAATYDGSGWGFGPPRPWSHYTLGDSRCDERPWLRECTQEYVCPVHRVVVMTYERAAAEQVLDFAPKRESWESRPLAGYVQTGPHSYERLGDGPDFRDVWREGLRAVRALSARGEW